MINRGQRITQRITNSSSQTGGIRGLCACFTDPHAVFQTTKPTSKVQAKEQGGHRQYIEKAVEHDLVGGMVTTRERYRTPTGSAKVWKEEASTTIRKSTDRTWALREESVKVEDELRLYLFGESIRHLRATLCYVVPTNHVDASRSPFRWASASCSSLRQPRRLTRSWHHPLGGLYVPGPPLSWIESRYQRRYLAGRKLAPA